MARVTNARRSRIGGAQRVRRSAKPRRLWAYHPARMCMQCVATAMTAVGAASGTRAYLGSRRYAWLTPKRLRAITIVLAIGAVLASATLVSGSG
jgi:hypothetical protein